MEIKYALMRELYTMRDYILKYEDRVLDYLFHARRHDDKDMIFCYSCNLDLLRTMRMEIDYEIEERHKEEL